MFISAIRSRLVSRSGNRQNLEGNSLRVEEGFLFVDGLRLEGNLFHSESVPHCRCQHLNVCEDALGLTAGLSEAFKSICVAYRTSDDDFDGGSKIEKHANSGDQGV
jgi:hypothetical protein